MIPKPIFTLIDTSIGSNPAVVVVNSALRAYKERDAFPWHLRITIACKLLGANGMPARDEGDILYQLEDNITSSLGDNAIFLARITASGERVLLYRINDPEAANDALQLLVTAPSQQREWDYRMEHDSDWALAQPELSLLERDPRFN